MRKNLILIGLAAALCQAAFAVPARPGQFRHVQPDGSVISLELHGDEFFHWTTDADGKVVEKDGEGFYRLAPEQSVATLRKAAAAARGIRPRGWSSYDNPRETNFGDRKVLAILVEFPDVQFTLEDPREKFTNLLNQPGYSYEGAHGSVRDYYLDNSLGQYRPQFDVYGPVTVSREEEYYAGSSGIKQVHLAVMEALQLLSSQIPLADYDTDSDGDIDMVLMYFAGHNQAEGAGEGVIWPHQSSGYIGTIEGKSINRYFCSSELRGASGSNITGIGTTCHEFGHSLGLPDFYDTDYEENGGENEFTTGHFDLMCSGNYNDSSRRPPYLSVMERNMLGWMPDPDVLTDPGSYILEPVQVNKGFRSNTPVEGEYFLYEYRNDTGWDQGLGQGLLIYHVDQSDNVVPGTVYTADELWKYSNKINAFYGHPCYYIKASSSTTYYFPGSWNRREFAPCTWDNQEGNVVLKDMAHDGSRFTFTCAPITGETLAGYGYAYISLYSDIPQVFPAAGKTLDSVSWTLDGKPVAKVPAKSTLTVGTHTFVATLKYTDGTTERVTQIENL